MKKIVKNVLVGSAGEDAIGSVVQEQMGYVWRPNTRHDVGYDGEIEVRDSETNIVSGLIIKVQSKRLQAFLSETEKSFVYTCDKDDIEYWMQSNIPDILVISKTGTHDLYWSPIKDYFAKHPEQKKENKIIFDKASNVFNASAKAAIASIAVAKNSGIYLPPLPMKEKLYTNLLEVKSMPKNMYIAQTYYRYPSSLIAAMQERNITTRSWILKNKILITFADLDPAWKDLIDPGTVEVFSTEEWVHTSDEDKKNELIQLLSKNLSEKCSLFGIRYDGKLKYYYFYPITIQTEREIAYKSQKQATKRQVIKALLSKEEPKHIKCYKHLAFKTKFIVVEQKWYLQITPTYHYTRDGKNLSLYNESMIKGLKRLQKNGSVRGEVLCIASILADGKPMQPIAKKEYLAFGELVVNEITGGIDDDLWTSSIDEEDKIETEEGELE